MKKILILLLVGTFFISGCLKIGSTPPPAVVGIFKSFDGGETWIERNLFLYSGGTGSMNTVSVKEFVFDPQDANAIYLMSKGNGLFYSYDSGDSWQKAQGVGDIVVESVAIDPTNKCTIYVTRANTILKSIDCNRSWSEVFIDTRADKLVTALAVDHFDSRVVYAGNSAGDILKSLDGGINWRVVNRINNPIKKFLIDPNDSRIIYIATQSAGLFKTISAGADWFDINDGLKPYSGSTEYKELIFDSTGVDSLMLVSKYGLLKTTDGGTTWQPLTLITPPATTDIFSVAISPANGQEIYYATASTFYKTFDGGENWVTKRLPSSGVAEYILIHPLQPNIIFMGMSN